MQTEIFSIYPCNFTWVNAWFQRYNSFYQSWIAFNEQLFCLIESVNLTYWGSFRHSHRRRALVHEAVFTFIFRGCMQLVGCCPTRGFGACWGAWHPPVIKIREIQTKFSFWRSGTTPETAFSALFGALCNSFELRFSTSSIAATATVGQPVDLQHAQLACWKRRLHSAEITKSNDHTLLPTGRILFKKKSTSSRMIRPSEKWLQIDLYLMFTWSLFFFFWMRTHTVQYNHVTTQPCN